MGANLYDMAKFLPDTVRIASSPIAPLACRRVNVTTKTFELRTVDVIATFMHLQRLAIAEAARIRDPRARADAIFAIRSLEVFTTTPINEVPDDE